MVLRDLAVYTQRALANFLGMPITLETAYAGDEPIWGELSARYPDESDAIGTRRIDLLLTVRVSESMPVEGRKALLHEVIDRLSRVNDLSVRGTVPVSDFYLREFNLSEGSTVLTCVIAIEQDRV